MTDSDERRERDEAATAEAAKRLFDESVERIDGATLSRLNRERQKALAGLHAGGRLRWQVWLPAAGTAVALAVTAAALFVWQTQAVRPAPPLDAVTDLDLLMEGENLEMLEDLEFYAWLEEEEPAPPVDDAADDHVG